MDNTELRNRADELNRRQMEILDRFPVLMGLDDADRRPIMDELMEMEQIIREVDKAYFPGYGPEYVTQVRRFLRERNG